MFTCTKRSPQQQFGQLLTVVAVPWTLFSHCRRILPFVCLTVGFVAGFARYRESSLREPAFFLSGLCTLHGPMVGLHMLSALTVLLRGWILLLLISIAVLSTMDGVRWRPEPCHCLSTPFLCFCFVFVFCCIFFLPWPASRF